LTSSPARMASWVGSSLTTIAAGFVSMLFMAMLSVVFRIQRGKAPPSSPFSPSSF
jgi:hypothetical protein